MDGMQDLHSLGVQVDPFFIDRNGEFDEDAYWNVRSFAGRYRRSRIRLRTFWKTAGYSISINDRGERC
jgi:hypothetical protein